jgi:DNA-binding GntR family transcriptional regulator
MPTSATEAAANQPLPRPASLKDAAYRQIKALLIAGRLERDKLYSAQFFAAMLGVSRTPVREALLQLANEGFLVCFDVKGFRVRDFSPKEIHDLFESRSVIETYLTKRLADNPSADDLRHMEESLRLMRACAARSDPHGFLEADKEFHLVPVRRLGNQHLASIMDNLRVHMSVLTLKALAHRGTFAGILREHTAILRALRRKDKKRAVQAMRHHLATTEQHLLEQTVKARR